MKQGIRLLVVLAMCLGINSFVSAQDASGRYFNLEFHAKGGYKLEGFSSGEAPSGRFRFDHLMVGLDGRLTPTLAYKYVQRFNKDATIYPLENLSNAIDYAYLRYTPTSRFALTVGRQALLVGGFEFQEYPIDVYDFSFYNNNITCYLTGVSTHFQLTPSQELALQVTNNRTHEPLSAFGVEVEASQLPFLGSLAWNSTYFDRLLQLRYGATYGPLAKGKSMFTIGGGHKLDFGKFNIYLDLLYYRSDLDYLGVLRSLPGQRAEDFLRTDYFSTVLEARYFFIPKWNLHLKLIYDLAEPQMRAERKPHKPHLERQLYQLALQYHPLDNRHFYFYLNGTYQAHQLDTPILGHQDWGQFKCALGVVARLSLFHKVW